MQGRYEEIRALGAEVIVVSFAPVERLPAYQALHAWPFPIVSDPDRAAYQAFGLGSAGWGALLRPRVWRRYFALVLQGHRIQAATDDVHQLGGDFVLDRSRRLLYAHRSTDPADRPPTEDLVKALEQAGPSGEQPT